MGRLIDADELEYTCNSDECGMLTGCNHCQYSIITQDEIDSAPTVEAIPKADYETRLKADMLSMLYKLRSEIINMPKYFPYADHTRMFIDGDVVVGFIANKIDTLRENEDGKNV